MPLPVVLPEALIPGTLNLQTPIVITTTPQAAASMRRVVVLPEVVVPKEVLVVLLDVAAVIMDLLKMPLIMPVIGEMISPLLKTGIMKNIRVL